MPIQSLQVSHFLNSNFVGSWLYVVDIVGCIVTCRYTTLDHMHVILMIASALELLEQIIGVNAELTLSKSEEISINFKTRSQTLHNQIILITSWFSNYLALGIRNLTTGLKLIAITLTSCNSQITSS